MRKSGGARRSPGPRTPGRPPATVPARPGHRGTRRPAAARPGARPEPTGDVDLCAAATAPSLAAAPPVPLAGRARSAGQWRAPPSARPAVPRGVESRPMAL